MLMPCLGALKHVVTPRVLQECGPSRRKGGAGEEHGAEPVRSRGVAGHLPGVGGRARRWPSSWRRWREALGTSVGKSRAHAGRGNDRTDF
jgi:hypothetical protein